MITSLPYLRSGDNKPSPDRIACLLQLAPTTPSLPPGEDDPPGPDRGEESVLAAHLETDDQVTVCDEHVERLDTDDSPDLVIIQVYITNTRRSDELAGLPSIFIGFESLSTQNLVATNKSQNHHYREAINRLSDLGIMVNGSFVFGLDADGPDVFERTVEWAVSSGLTTATFHIATPYPGAAYHQELAAAGRILHQDWERYDTRHAVFQPANMTVDQLEAGYRRSYEQFYTWRNIAASPGRHDDRNHALRHFAYAAGWNTAWRVS